MSTTTTVTKKRKDCGSYGEKGISSSAAAILGYNFDILILILIHLPLKSLLVCKSVSKQWLSIITDPQFIHQKHCIRNGRLKIPGLFLMKDSWRSGNREYDYICIDGNVSSTCVPFKAPIFAGKDQTIVASCNGLLLCGNYEDFKYSIYNPFTRQYRILLSFIPSRWDDMRSVSDMELAFDPMKSLHYKVVCIRGRDSRSSGVKRIEIYSSETSSWRRCKKAYLFRNEHRKSCVFWNGSLNWITNNGILIYFNTDKETLGEVASPWKQNSRWCTNGNCLDVYGGQLLCLLLNLDISTRFDVLEMEANYSGWVSKYKVDMEGLKGSYPELGGSCSNYKVVFMDEVEEFSPKFIVLIYESDVIISYDSERNYHTVLYVDEWQSLKWFNDVYKYVESLACV